MSDNRNKLDFAAGKPDQQAENKSALPEILDDIDLSVLFDFEAAQGEDEPDLIVELIDLYLADVPPLLSAIKDFISEADEASLKRAAHNLKGSSANLGIIGMTRLCEDLEQMDFIESPQLINVCVKSLEQTFARVRRILTLISHQRTGLAQ